LKYFSHKKKELFAKKYSSASRDAAFQQFIRFISDC